MSECTAGAMTVRDATNFVGIGRTSLYGLIKNGTLKLGDVAPLPTNAVFTGSGTLEFATAGTFAHDITEDGGNGTVLKSSSGELELTGNNSYSKLVVSEGDVRGDTQSIEGNVELAASSKLLFDQDFKGTHSGDISG